MPGWKPSCFIIHDVPQELRALWWVYFHSTILFLFFMYMQSCCHKVVNGVDSTSVAFKPRHTNIHWILPWGIETLVVLRDKRASRFANYSFSVDTHNNGCKTLHPSLLQIMAFSNYKFWPKSTPINHSKKNHRHFGQVIFDMIDLIVAFLTNQVVDYLISQINQRNIWATIFLGQFLI